MFNGDKYAFWSVNMKTLFKLQDLWELVEEGFLDSDEATRLRENKKKDAKALFFLQQAVHENIFPRIMGATSSKEAWFILQKEFQGDSKVITVKLQALRREFETAMMKDKELVQEFLSKLSTIVSQMRMYGETCNNQTIVAKVLRSLTPRFDHVVAAIEELEDLTIFSFDKLMGSLQAHEARINHPNEHT
ncbi:UBN2 domain-containing protein [Cephalotus follicularis]|uniref:UBN2 domain-containing protein n=1 Tax=Cephalotus follicularis TaxID=3775 RepID=A0A1Q3CXW0_CEPFO|nr:UBN2 domain-containing protein [Cephalotus follicularis]